MEAEGLCVTLLWMGMLGCAAIVRLGSAYPGAHDRHGEGEAMSDPKRNARRIWARCVSLLLAG